MKKLLSILLIILVIFSFCNAQWLPLDPIYQLDYFYEGYTFKTMILQDTILFLTRHGGIEKVNMNDYSIESTWANCYPVKRIVSDTGNTYVYLIDNDDIMKFNPVSQQYENIWPDNLQYHSLIDIEVAPDGKVWAAANFGYNKEIACYDGEQWELFPFPQNLYSGLQEIELLNDTLVYIFGGSTRFYTFHNGVFDTLYIDDGYVKHWDIDIEGNIWAARGSDLLYLSDGQATVYDSTNCPIGTDEFLVVRIGTDGHIWTSGNSNRLLEFDGSTWWVRIMPVNYPHIENFILNSQDKPIVIVHNYEGRQLYKMSGVIWLDSPIPYMPIANAKAIGIKTHNNDYGYFANDEGFFIVNMNNLRVTDFIDTSYYPYANEVTCFADYSKAYSIPAFGTTSGVGGIQDFDNNQLHSMHINYISYANGTYYIATDSGLVAYNGILYTHINTSNSPLPSDKITFVTTSNINWNSKTVGLYIGTDKGVAIYENAQWTVFDSTNIPIDNFNVTGVLPPIDGDETYISTLGSGLIKVSPDGEYELYNTANGNFLDDTLYYIRFMELGECGAFIVVGTNNNGIAYTDLWWGEEFYYETNYNNTLLTNSKMAVNGDYFEMNMIATDAMYFILTPCGSVKENKTSKQLAWHQQGNTLKISVPENLHGKGEIRLSDILGKTVIKKQTNILSHQFELDIRGLKTGIYIFSITTGNKMGYSKVVISR